MDIVKRKLVWVNPTLFSYFFFQNHQALNSKDDPGALTSSFVLVIGGSISRSFLMACNGGSLK